MRSFGQDLVVAWRALWRAKPFATAAILTLGLGIAGVAVLLAFIQGVLLRPLPIRDQDRVIVAWKQLPVIQRLASPICRRCHQGGG